MGRREAVGMAKTIAWIYHDFMRRSDGQMRSDREELLQVSLPLLTKRSLKVRAARTGKTMRVIVLHALAADGIRVPPGELHDRRKPR